LKVFFVAKDSYDSMINGYRNTKKEVSQRFSRVRCLDLRRSTSLTVSKRKGKSLMLNQLALIKAINNGDKVAVFPENMPLDDFITT
jgi:hypothetical protein